MTVEEAREYWSRRLERAESYSDEHWDAEERHAHKDYVDAMMCAITALAIMREREGSQSQNTDAYERKVCSDFDHDDHNCWYCTSPERKACYKESK